MMEIKECIIDLEIFKKMNNCKFKFINLTPNLLGLKAVIAQENSEILSCAILDNSRTMPQELVEEIFMSFEDAIDNLQLQIESCKQPVYAFDECYFNRISEIEEILSQSRIGKNTEEKTIAILKDEIKCLKGDYEDDDDFSYLFSDEVKECTQKIKLLETTMKLFKEKGYYYVVYIESLREGDNIASQIVEYINNNYENIVTLPCFEIATKFWRKNGFKEIDGFHFKIK